MNDRTAPTTHDLHDLITRRWSPYAFSGETVDAAHLQACLEAASWAASSFNEQPWTFLIAERSDEAGFAAALECLLEANQAWAKEAGALLLTTYTRQFTRNGKPNRAALHDLGLAVGNLTTQATALGLHVHQMAGVNLDKIRVTYGIPETHEPFSAIAIGHVAKDLTGNPFAERDQGNRSRKALDQIVFRGEWGRAAF